MSGKSSNMTESSLKLTLPDFSANVQTWFQQINTIFTACHITSQSLKYTYVIEKLPTDVAAEISDLLTDIPSEKPYDKLKDTILQQTGHSVEQKLKELFTNISLENI